MCEIADNDYDIGYFGARAIICDELITKYRNKDLSSIEDIHTYLLAKFQEEKGHQREYIDENNCESEKIQGFIDESFFLLNMINQGPFKVD